MSDSTTNLDTVSQASNQREAQVNALMDAASGATVFGRRASTCAGLVFGYYGGRFNGTSVANGTVTATASNTNYVVAHRSTLVVSISTSNTNWNDTTTYGRLYKLTAGGSSVTAYEDHRAGTSGILTPDLSTFVTSASITAAINGLSWKQTVRAATTANGTLATAFANGQTIDGVTLVTADRILLKNQTSGSENGIYVVAASGAPTRSTDADSGAELVDATVYVSEGTTNADTQWTCTTNATITLGSTALVFAQVAAGVYQPLDSDLTTIAGLTATTDSFMQAKSSAWAARTVAQVSTDLVGTGLITDAIGFRTVPQNSQSAAYTAVAADSGKSIDHPATDANARTFTIDSNANVAYPVGTCITFTNMTANVVTIAITSDTMYLAGAGTTGSRSLAQYGMATARKLTSTTWLIAGTGLT